MAAQQKNQLEQFALALPLLVKYMILVFNSAVNVTWFKQRRQIQGWTY
jgi:hypothetical protein